MNLKINADDLGASPCVSETILNHLEAGRLSHASILVNGADAGRACRKLSEFHYGSNLHLNFCEGKALLPPSQIPLLVDAKGQFCRSFPVFWLFSIFSRDFRNQVEEELKAQVQRYRELLSLEGSISLDSHQHYHLIPPLLGIIAKNAKSFSVSYVRMTDEPLLFPKGGRVFALKNLCSLNVVKWLLLKVLAQSGMRKLRRAGIGFNRYFCGVLYTGKMKKTVYDAFMSFLEKKGADSLGEILFHPGGASREEGCLWAAQKGLRNFYTSPQRQQESRELTSL